jgi:phosphatidate cytidylyltransferase
LRVRLFGTIALLVPFIALAWADFYWNGEAPGAWLFLVALAAAQLATLELHPLLSGSSPAVSQRTCQLGVFLVMLATAVPVYWPLAMGEPYPRDCPIGRVGCTLFGLVLVMVVALAQKMRGYQQPTGRVVTDVALIVFAAAYVGVLLSILILLRTFHDNRWGMAALLSMMAIVKSADIGAYLAGRAFGRHRLAPLLSPKKTMEGAVGGMVAAVVVGVSCPALIVEPLVGERVATSELGGWLFLGLLLGITGIFGDLAESLIKRDCGQKDSSRWLPGLGGMLDLLDSMLFAAPVAYAAWSVGLVGPK